MTTQASPDVVNPFGFAAFGALVGLFSAQASEWLKRIFEQVFAPAMKGTDPAIEVRITDVQPDPAPVGHEVVITGTGGRAKISQPPATDRVPSTLARVARVASASSLWRMAWAPFSMAASLLWPDPLEGTVEAADGLIQ